MKLRNGYCVCRFCKNSVTDTQLVIHITDREYSSFRLRKYLQNSNLTLGSDTRKGKMSWSIAAGFSHNSVIRASLLAIEQLFVYIQTRTFIFFGVLFSSKRAKNA